MPVSNVSAAQERLIAALSPSLQALALRGVLRTYKKSSIVINEGDAGETLFILLQGSVKVYSTDQSGREITYGTIGAGDYFGEMSLGRRAALGQRDDPGALRLCRPDPQRGARASGRRA